MKTRNSTHTGTRLVYDASKFLLQGYKLPLPDVSDHSSPRHELYEKTGLLENNQLVGLGTRKIIPKGGSSVYCSIPQPFAREFGIESDTEVEVFLHPKLNAFLVAPVESE